MEDLAVSKSQPSATPSFPTNLKEQLLFKPTFKSLKKAHQFPNTKWQPNFEQPRDITECTSASWDF